MLTTTLPQPLSWSDKIRSLEERIQHNFRQLVECRRTLKDLKPKKDRDELGRDGLLKLREIQHAIAECEEYETRLKRTVAFIRNTVDDLSQPCPPSSKTQILS